MREGNLEAPTRHPIDWRNPSFYDETATLAEMERVFDICHGCRRCVSLCQSFPNLFDLVDATSDGEVHGVKKEDYWKVVDQCYLCDLCFMTKCPYTPPHKWNLDFPHLMLRAKAIKHAQGGVSARDKLLASTDLHGQFAGIPIVSQVVNQVNATKTMRKILDRELHVPRGLDAGHRDPALPLGPGDEQPGLRGARRRAHAGPGGDLLDLHRQLQRARDR
jgi:ferredoxin